MRVVSLLVLLLCLPLVAADGWYYAGDTWEEDSILYSLEGNDYGTAMLGVNSDIYLLSFCSCKMVNAVEYCYTSTAEAHTDCETGDYVAEDETYITYEAGEKLAGYYITIESFEPDIDVDREILEPDETHDYTKVEITLSNEGDYRVTDLEYSVPLPGGLKVISGPKTGDTILYKYSVLATGQKTRFSYSVLPDQFGTFDFSPNLTYEYDGTIFSVDPGDWTLDQDTPIDVVTYITEEMEIDELGHFEINITNDEDEELPLSVYVNVPGQVEVINPKGFALDLLSAKFDLRRDETEILSFDFYTSGSATITTTVNFTSGSYESTDDYTASTTTAEEYVVPEVRVFPSAGPFYSGTKLNISGLLENLNDKVRFKNVKGEMRSDLFDTLTFSQTSIGPTAEVLEAEALITTPQVDVDTVFTVILEGSYESPRGSEYAFSDSASLTIVPFIRSVEIIRSYDPLLPRPGENVTITVTAKNVEGTYLTFDAHERFSNSLVKSGGLTFAELSLERDASQKLYTYSLDIPEDYDDDTMTVTTIVLVKDDVLTEESSTVIELGEPLFTDTEEEVVEEEEVTEVVVESDDDSPSYIERKVESVKGFLGRTWDRVKALFSSDDEEETVEETDDVEPSEDIVENSVGECEELPDKLRGCQPYTCTFTHPLMGGEFTREIVGVENDLCVFVEGMPNDGELRCAYDGDYQYAVASYYEDVLEDETGTYTLDGVEVENPLDHALENGVCVISGY